MISTMMAKICLQTVIFHAHISNAITTMTAVYDKKTTIKVEYIDDELSMELSFDL
jgi:hypothetical protein